MNILINYFINCYTLNDSLGGLEQIFQEFTDDSFVSRPVNDLVFSKLEHLFNSTCNFEALVVGAKRRVCPGAILIFIFIFLEILILYSYIILVVKIFYQNRRQHKSSEKFINNKKFIMWGLRVILRPEYFSLKLLILTLKKKYKSTKSDITFQIGFESNLLNSHKIEFSPGRFSVTSPQNYFYLWPKMR